jgi:hypothetical protein
MESVGALIVIVVLLVILAGLAGAAIGLVIGMVIGQRDDEAAPSATEPAPALPPRGPLSSPAAEAVQSLPDVRAGMADAASFAPLAVAERAPERRRAQSWSVVLAFAVIFFCCFCTFLTAAIVARS